MRIILFAGMQWSFSVHLAMFRAMVLKIISGRFPGGYCPCTKLPRTSWTPLYYSQRARWLLRIWLPAETPSIFAFQFLRTDWWGGGFRLSKKSVERTLQTCRQSSYCSTGQCGAGRHPGSSQNDYRTITSSSLFLPCGNRRSRFQDRVQCRFCDSGEKR